MLKILIVLLFTLSCSQSKITLNSRQKKVGIHAYDHKQKNFKYLGNTPLKLDKTKDLKNFERDGVLYFKLTKKGFNNESVIIVPINKSNTEVFATLQETADWTNSGDKQAASVIDRIGREIQTINSLIRKNRTDLALAKVNGLVKEFPYVPLFYDIQGSLFLLQKKTKFAISSYEKSLKLNPQNTSTREIMQKLKSGRR